MDITTEQARTYMAALNSTFPGFGLSNYYGKPNVGNPMIVKPGTPISLVHYSYL
jgi:hypothetical protein